MKIDIKAKTEIYYLMLFWATDELLKLDKKHKEENKKSAIFTSEYLIEKINFNNMFLSAKRKRVNSKNLKKKIVKLLEKIQKCSIRMDFLSFEMLIYICLNYLVLELNQKDMKNYQSIDITSILDDIYAKYPDEMKQHYKFFEEIIENV